MRILLIFSTDSEYRNAAIIASFRDARDSKLSSHDFASSEKHIAFSYFPRQLHFLEHPLLLRSRSHPRSPSLSVYFSSLDFPLPGIIKQLTFVEISSNTGTQSRFAFRFALSVSYLCSGSRPSASCQNALGHSPFEHIFKNKFATSLTFSFFPRTIRCAGSSSSFSKQ